MTLSKPGDLDTLVTHSRRRKQFCVSTDSSYGHAIGGKSREIKETETVTRKGDKNQLRELTCQNRGQPPSALGPASRSFKSLMK